MKRRHAVVVAGLVVFLSIFAVESTAEETIFDNSITPPVENVPLKPAQFSLFETRKINRIQTLHWNNGQGAKPGSIALQTKDRRLLGPWEAKGVKDEQGLANAYWEAHPGIELDAGTYTVLDSDPATWARNPVQGNIGVFKVFGQQSDAAAQQPLASDQGDKGHEGDAAAADKLSLEEQQVRATELFNQIIQTDNYELDTIEHLYLQVIQECPDTEKAEESYFRLSNLYRMGFDPPEYKKLMVLLEEFLVRYPDSEGRAEMRDRLLRAYESSGQWDKVVAIYDEIVPGLSQDYPYYLVTHLDYARALEGIGDRDRALNIYQKVAEIAGGANAAQYDMSDFWLRVAQERIDIIQKIKQQRWQDVADIYQEQFSKIAWAEMPQIQELFEYADALEKVGKREDAIKQFKGVLRTDQGYETRQAVQARERLAALGATPLTD